MDTVGHLFEVLCGIRSDSGGAYETLLKWTVANASAQALREAFVESAPSIESAVAASLAEYGPAAKMAVIPKGPYVLAQVA